MNDRPHSHLTPFLPLTLTNRPQVPRLSGEEVSVLLKPKQAMQLRTRAQGSDRSGLGLALLLHQLWNGGQVISFVLLGPTPHLCNGHSVGGDPQWSQAGVLSVLSS